MITWKEQKKRNLALGLLSFIKKASKKALKFYAEKREIAYSGTPKNLLPFFFHSQFDDKSSHFMAFIVAFNGEKVNRRVPWRGWKKIFGGFAAFVI